MTKPTRDDLWVTRWIEEGPRNGTHDLVQATDADLEQMGLVQRPTCTECGGDGYTYDPTMTRHRCPQCGGSGYGRLVNLDVAVEALRRQLASWDDGHRTAAKVGYLAEVARQVLAALDGETT